MMLTQLRRGHQQDFDGTLMSARTLNNHDEQWKYSDRPILPDAYPVRSNSTMLPPDLSRALHVDAHLLAIVRIEDRRSNHYATEVVNKLRHKEQTQGFINKPCSLIVTDRSLLIFDRMSQNVAETIPLENIDPTCVQSDTPDHLNDIFMYRLYERHSNQLNTSTHSTSSHDRMSTVVVFKCSNRQSKTLVDSIRTAAAKQLRQPRSARSESRNAMSNRTGVGPLYGPPPASTIVTDQPPPPMTPRPTEDHYKRLTVELNKCFDDIEAFVRHLEIVSGFTRKWERSLRKSKKNNPPTTTTTEFPDDKYFVDVLQKFKHSFNLIGELKHIIHNPNGPELIHYLLSPLQFILISLRRKHSNEAQLAQGIWTPMLAKDARELLVNCLTSREHDIIKDLGPAWLPINDETPARPMDYRPAFFEGREPWIIDDDTLPSARTRDRRSPAPPPQSARSNTGRPASPSVRRNDTSTMDRSLRDGPSETYTQNHQNENLWAIERKRAGAKICAVKTDRPGQNAKELTVRRGELIEILDSSRNWWRARNFQGTMGHVPNNIVEEIDIEQRSLKVPPSNPSVLIPRSSSVPMRVHGYPSGHEGPLRAHGYNQYIVRSPSNGNNFIMQSNHSTSTRPMITRQDYFQTQSINSGSIPPPAPPLPIQSSSVAPPPPPPPPLPANFSSPQTSPWSTLQMPNSSREDRLRTHMNGTTPRQDKLQKELAQRITDRVGVLNPNSSKDDVKRWLISKEVSPELAQNLRDFNGEQLFGLTLNALEGYTNQSEASRVYALLLQQKQLAGYHIDDAIDGSNSFPNFGFGSLKARTPRDPNDSFALRSNDSLSRSLKIKLKQRRDKIEQAESAPTTVL